MGRDAQSMEAVRKKVAFVTELIKAEPSLTMMAVGGRVKETFGKLLAPDKLRAAYVAGGGVVLPRGRRRVSAPAETVSAEEQATKETQVPSVKTNRRKPGRRKSDHSAAIANKTLSRLPQHVVVLRTKDAPELHEFDTPKHAAAYVRKKVQAGVPTSALAYYKRESVEIRIGL